MKRVSEPLQMVQLATPGEDPPAGSSFMYVKSDGQPHTKNSSGTELLIGVPIGSIQAWHKSLPGVPGLPLNWVQCDGQVLNDTESPLNGQTIPNLNGQARFLRGNSVSGTDEADDFKSHNHQGGVEGLTPQGSFGLIRVATAGEAVTVTGGDISPGEPDLVTGPQNIPLEGGAETRPINMSVVWIMKIK